MGIIKIHDKYFKQFIEFDRIDKQIERVAFEITRDTKGTTPLFLVILNGAFMFATDLIKKLDFPCEISFVKLASYQGTTTTEKVRQLIGFDEDIEGRTIIVVEDIVDSGITMESVLDQLKRLGAKDVKIATMLFKPKAFRKSYNIDYIGMEIPNDFIVGYGLDYDGLGRNYKDIYILTNKK